VIIACTRIFEKDLRLHYASKYTLFKQKQPRTRCSRIVGLVNTYLSHVWYVRKEPLAFRSWNRLPSRQTREHGQRNEPDTKTGIHKTGNGQGSSTVEAISHVPWQKHTHGSQDSIWQNRNAVTRHARLIGKQNRRQMERSTVCCC
jgi:hypothetical protein